MRLDVEKAKPRRGDDGEDALRCLGIGQRGKLTIREFLQRNSMGGQVFQQLATTVGPLQRGTVQRSPKLNTGLQGFLHQPHALHHRQAAALAALALL